MVIVSGNTAISPQPIDRLSLLFVRAVYISEKHQTINHKP